MYFLYSKLMSHYIFIATSAFDWFPCPLTLEWVLISEFKMTWELFITIIKFVWQMFFLWKTLDGCFLKEMLKMFFCDRNQDVVRSVVRKHRVAWRIWQGGVEHSATRRSILFGYCDICPFKERIYESSVPFLTLAIHFSVWEYVSRAASHHSFHISSWDWFVMWHTTHLTRHARCSWF